MHAKYILTVLAAGSLLVGCTKPVERIKNNGPEVVDFRVLPFPIHEVKLLDGPFEKATQLDEQTLLAYNPDRLLAKFRSEAGLKPKAEHYHGWEDNTIAGHSLGHYLTAVCQMYATTGNPEFLKRANYIVDELNECQKADTSGYIGAFPNGKRILEDEVAKGNIRSKGFDLNGIWVPYYTEHKVMDGLFHAYTLCGIKKALDINIKFADWLYNVVKNLTDAQVQEMLNCEHGGINEMLAELYGFTGNKKYLDMSHIFHHKAVIDSLAHHKDILPGRHANTQIPKLVGTARRYELTGDSADLSASLFFWDRIVNHHSYVTGGNGNHEYLGAPDSLNNRLSNGTTETCNVFNMLKLSEHLFMWNADAKVADYYERALLNHILSSQHPNDGRVVYNLSLEMGGFKEYQDPEWFTCCVGTGMENHSKYSKNIYYHNHHELYIFQYIASELTWKEKGLTLTQHTQYPNQQGTTLTFSCEKPIDLTLQIRYPYWAQNGLAITINGKTAHAQGKPGSFVPISRRWENGDKVEVSFLFSLRVETMPDNPNRVALMNGPLVLAADLGPVDDSSAADPMYVPVLLTESRTPASWTAPVAGEPNTFFTQHTGRPKDITLKPFYLLHDRRYSVYFDLFDSARWATFQADYKAKLEEKKQLELTTIDFCQMGEMQPERDHDLASDKSWVEEFKNKKCRSCDNGGYIEFLMKVDPKRPTTLLLEYMGGMPGARTFTILANNTPIATEWLNNLNTDGFVLKKYPLPANLKPQNGRVKIKIVPAQGHRAGPVFSARTIR